MLSQGIQKYFSRSMEEENMFQKYSALSITIKIKMWPHHRSCSPLMLTIQSIEFQSDADYFWHVLNRSLSPHFTALFRCSIRLQRKREGLHLFAEFNRSENDWNIQFYSYAYAFLQFSVDSSKYLYGSGRYPRNITVDWLMRSDRLETFVGKTRHYSPSGISYG